MQRVTSSSLPLCFSHLRGALVIVVRCPLRLFEVLFLRITLCKSFPPLFLGVRVMVR